MRVYHGSDHVIKQPQYLGGKADNDYENGFYTTEYEDKAKSWGAYPANSIVNIYELDLDKLKILFPHICRGSTADTWIWEIRCI